MCLGLSSWYVSWTKHCHHHRFLSSPSVLYSDAELLIITFALNNNNTTKNVSQQGNLTNLASFRYYCGTKCSQERPEIKIYKCKPIQIPTMLFASTNRRRQGNSNNKEYKYKAWVRKAAIMKCISWDATISYLRLIVIKMSKENLKPRKGELNQVKFLQCNMQKSQHAQIDLNRRISEMNKDRERFFCCLQEPCSVKSKLISQPNSVQRFGKSICPRTCIYVDAKTDAWFLEALSTKDITAIQVSILKQHVLVVR